MNNKPVKRYGVPRYPSKLQVVADPALLRKNVPLAWRVVPEMAGAMALLVALSTAGCSKGRPVVAPIFDHGTGRGSTGCVSVSPPVFLSEEEAMQVIREELAKGNVQLTHTNWEISGTKSAKRSLRADAFDAKKRVAVEFVSQSEYSDLKDAKEDTFLNDVRNFFPVSISTVHSYDFRPLAQFLSNCVKAQAKGRLYFGVFYDPLAGKMDMKDLAAALSSAKNEKDDLAAWQSLEYKWKSESRRLLRLQVQDFVKWLQAQGAI